MAPLVLNALKRDCTPREIVAQALDCASWVAELKPEDIVQIMFYENWTSRALWQTHMGAPHVAAHRAATEGMVVNVRLHEMRVIG